MLNFLVIAAISLQTVVGTAQGAQGQGAARVSSAASVALEQKISLDITNAPLAKALDEVAVKSGLEISYSRSLVENAPRVTLQNTHITVGDALKHLLRNTHLAVTTYAGKIAITQQSQASRTRVQGVIAGRVTDGKTGKAISGANVSAGSDNRGVMTGDDGAYRLSGVAAGMQTVTVRLVGYAKQSKSVTVGDGATVTADFKLEPSANVLDQVIVTGTVVQTELKAVPNAMSVITARQIEERGITRIDQLFRGDVPGVFAMNRGSDNPVDSSVTFSRGASKLDAGNGAVSYPMKVYVDGIEMSRPAHLNQIDPKSIERIEILTGPQASTIYGSNAINGVMQIFTKRGTTAHPRVAIGATTGIAQNNFNTALAPSHIGDARISGIEGRWAYDIGGSAEYQGAWTPAKRTVRSGVSGAARLVEKSFTTDVSSRYAVVQTRTAGGTSQGTVSKRATGLYSPSPSSNGQRSSYSSTDQAFGLTIGYNPGTWWSHELSMGKDATHFGFIFSTLTYANPGDTLLWYQQDFDNRVSQRYVTTLGGHIGSSMDLRLTLGADHWRMTSSNIFALPGSLTGTLANPDITRTRPGKNTGSFGQVQFSLKDAMFLTYGLRAEWNPNFGDEVQPNLAPRYGVAYMWELGEITGKLRAAYGRSTRPPTLIQKQPLAVTNTTVISQFGSFNSRLANPELGPEYQQGGEGGIELYFGRRGSLVVTRYNQTVNALISNVGKIDSIPSLLPAASLPCGTVQSDGYCYQYQSQNLNVGSIRNQGWELQSNVNTGAFTTRGTYSWTKSRIIGITPKYRDLVGASRFLPGESFSFLAEHVWSVTESYAKAATTVAVNVSGVGNIYRTADELSRVTSHRLTATMVRIGAPDRYRAVGRGYVTADLNASHHFSSRLDGTLQIQNLTDFYQTDNNVDYVTIGRQTRLGMRLRLN